MTTASLRETKTADQVRIGRLEKKIRKLEQQRDHFKERYEHYAHVISMQPYLERRWESYTAMKTEIERIKQLEARVREQALLIKALSEVHNERQNDSQPQ